MEITVIGTGYVGLVAGSCLAGSGNRVTCADVDEEKIRRLNSGDVPIYEPGIERLISEGLAAGRLRFTTDATEGVRTADAIFVAVGTPPGQDGLADLDFVLDAARVIGDHLRPGAVVVMKSTVPVGTSEIVRAEIARRADLPFHMCSNPEFLKEGDAVGDFLYPDRVVCGVDSDRARRCMEELYEPFIRSGNPLIFMDIASAELTKYAANAMLAARIGMMNQFAELCEQTGADIERVRRGVGSDPRIGSAFLYAGTGYGGSCLPKDVRAIIRSAKKQGVDLGILKSVSEANDRQTTVLVRKIRQRFGDDLTGLRFALWGLAFKPRTDDMREAPSRAVAEGLRERGASVVAHDPAAMEPSREFYLGDAVEYAANEYEALDGADALVVVTEWLQYRRPDWSQLAQRMARPIVFDGRNVFEPDRMASRGFEHYPVGRRQIGPAEIA
ncbi:UDP-glucose dehydrogenase family protein [Candidatus Palauibacter sp.]|uniref:UDP-glucose dehydrogenase family protein n=1 Tax=Candidatus Palauibacter sp. TaxID=3101350 RepID=UPI003B0160BB